ncbi:MAG: DUF4382 domain-containing protein [Candidatus Eisenbacteria bacterium]
MRHNLSILLLTVAIASAVLVGCSSSPSGPGFGTMNVRMTDAPGAFDHVNLVVTQVSAHLAGAAAADSDSAGSNSGWITLSSEAVTYDLLTLQNGVFVTIGTGRIPAGHYTQIRLKLGAGSTVVVDGVTYPLTVPSGLQTGLKLVGSFDVPANGLLDVALDFDAARSVIQNGAGLYHLKPTVRVMPFSTAGAITGQVAPADVATTIFAVQASDTLGSALAAADGKFTVSVLAPGSYALAFHPASGFRDTTLASVVVASQVTTNVGTVQLTPQ